jgi:hypothetical protein
MDEKNLADFHQLQKSPELLFPYVWPIKRERHDQLSFVFLCHLLIFIPCLKFSVTFDLETNGM